MLHAHREEKGTCSRRRDRGVLVVVPTVRLQVQPTPSCRRSRAGGARPTLPGKLWLLLTPPPFFLRRSSKFEMLIKVRGVTAFYTLASALPIICHNWLAVSQRSSILANSSRASSWASRKTRFLTDEFYALADFRPTKETRCFSGCATKASIDARVLKKFHASNEKTIKRDVIFYKNSPITILVFESQSFTKILI